jgi:predicted lactoylglutathione lyase
MTGPRIATPATIAYPIADRLRAFRFYRDLGFATPGELADDGVPEPLQVTVNDGLSIMLVPAGGFGWVTAGADTAGPGTVECQMSVTMPDRANVDAFVDVARTAGATILSGPHEQAWGYNAVFADPDGHQWMILTEPVMPVAQPGQQR